MIKGLLLYDPLDVRKNTWFIEHLVRSANRYGLGLDWQAYTDESLDGAEDRYDFCINRTRHSQVNDRLEPRVRCYNNRDTVRIANNKWLTYRLCQKWGIPTMETVAIDNPSAIPLDYPYVLKSNNGHGGSEVYWISERTDIPHPLTNTSGYIAQKPATDGATDVRIYALGGEAVMGVRRHSDRDFRSNYSLGGQVELVAPTDEQRQILHTLYAALQMDYVGVDFLLHQGQWVLNEIEDAVGARMLYSLTDYDMGDAFMRYIYEDIKNRP